MPNWRRFLAALVIVLLGAPVLAMAAVDLADDDAAVLTRNALATDYPGIRLQSVDGQLLRVYGTRFCTCFGLYAHE